MCRKTLKGPYTCGLCSITFSILCLIGERRSKQQSDRYVRALKRRRRSHGETKRSVELDDVAIDAQDTHSGTESDGVLDDQCDESERRNSVADMRYDDRIEGTLNDNVRINYNFDVDHDISVRNSVVDEDDRIEDEATNEARTNEDNNEQNEFEPERNDVAEEFYDDRMSRMAEDTSGNEEGDCQVGGWNVGESLSSRSGSDDEPMVDQEDEVFELEYNICELELENELLKKEKGELI